MRAPLLAVCDVGNSALKVVLFGPRGGVVEAHRFPFGPGGLPPGTARRLRSLPRPSAVVSVNRRHLRLLEGALRRGGLPLVGREIPLAVKNRTHRPAETGDDRLCAAAAAHGRARGPAVAVGLGTALTVDAVDGEGAFLGGSIGPGLAAGAAGLAAAAPRLPRPDLSPGRRAPFPGRTTGGALRAGFLLGLAGAVDRLVGEATRAAGGGRRPVPVLLHGGDAPALLPLLAFPAVHAPHLVAEGARLLLLGARAR